MYIVTAFALNYSTQNMGLPRELFLNIGLLVGGLSCLTIPCFAWLADRFGRRRVYITGALIGTLSAFPFFMALEAQSIFWIVFFSIMLANIAHDMVVCVQQPMFTEMFGASYRYSGAGVGYQVASVVGGGFTPFIAAALITYFAGNWHSVAIYLLAGCVAIYLLAGCLISAMTALLMKDNDRFVDERQSTRLIAWRRSSDLRLTLLFHIPVTYYRMCGNCMEQETHMNNKGSGLTPAQALDKLDALYEQSVVALRNAIGKYITSGELPDENARKQGLFVYPSLTVTWDGSTTNPPKTRAFGRFTHAGSYTTTITRPTLFRSYLNEQLTLLYQDYGAHISVQPSQHEIRNPLSLCHRWL